MGFPKFITDRNGRVLGQTREDAHGSQILTDRNGNVQGRFENSTGNTTDRNGNIVTRGNNLSIFLNK